MTSWTLLEYIQVGQGMGLLQVIIFQVWQFHLQMINDCFFMKYTRCFYYVIFYEQRMLRCELPCKSGMFVSPELERHSENILGLGPLLRRISNGLKLMWQQSFWDKIQLTWTNLDLLVGEINKDNLDLLLVGSINFNVVPISGGELFFFDAAYRVKVPTFQPVCFFSVDRFVEFTCKLIMFFCLA